MESKFGEWVIANQDLPKSGQGKAKIVYREGNLHDRYVLKEMNGDGSFLNRRERFEAEIKAYKLLSHPNLARMEGYGYSGKKNNPFIVTEYCGGGCLTPGHLSGLTLIDRLGLFKGICAGVAHAHKHGVIHRDLKPENIFLHSDGTPVIGDFGLCYFVDDDSGRATDIGEVVGARFYMAPECEGGRSETVDARCDVYSLGKVLYWLLACRIFAREQHESEQFDLRLFQPSDEMRFVYYKLFDRTIQVDPTARFPNAIELHVEVCALMKQFVSRRRMHDLANAVVSENDPPVRIAEFRRGSLVQHTIVHTAGMAPKGFAAKNHQSALWAVGSGRDPNEVAIFIRESSTSWRANTFRSSGTLSVPRMNGHHALAFDSALHPCLAIVEKIANDSSSTLTILTADSKYDLTRSGLQNGVNDPRSISLAFGNSGAMAVSLDSTVYVKAPNGAVECQTFREFPGFNWPLVYDSHGKAHMASVNTESAGGTEWRKLEYVLSDPTGGWTRTVIEEAVANGNEPLAKCPRMSGHISLCLDASGNPKILSDASRISRNHIVVHSLEAGMWKCTEIDLHSFLDDFGLYQIETGGPKQILFDSFFDGKNVVSRYHVAMLSRAGDQDGVIYLLLNEGWQIVERRYLPASSFWGMATIENSVQIAIT